MKIKKLSLSISCLTAIFITLFFVVPVKHSGRTYAPRNVMVKAGISDAVKWLSMIRNNLVTGTLDLRDVLEARMAAEQLSAHKSSKALNLNWSEVGPDDVGGRTRAILWDKNDPTYKTIFAGGVSGGLWKSTDRASSWHRVTSLSENLAISCITQGADGTIYVGTGEGLAQPGGTNGNTGTLGSGIFKSTDGVNFSVITSTKPVVNSYADWSVINRIGCDPVNPLRIYVAAYKFLQSDNGGTTWYQPKYLISGTTYSAIPGYAKDVKVGADGTVAVSAGDNSASVFVSPSGNDQTYYKCSGTNTGLLPTDVMRVELAIAPSDPNYIYALPAKSGTTALKGLYRSTDKGHTWTLLAPGGSANFDVFGYGNPTGVQQGYYDNVMAVFPNNKDHIVFGGINMWEWELGSEPKQISIGDNSYRYKYIHVDQHVYTFHPTDPRIFMVGTDGGLSISTDGGLTFSTVNRYYAATQFYAVACDGYGALMGGTQDNSTPYVPRTGADRRSGYVLWSGDGGWSAFSLINPGAMFFTSQSANLGRTSDRYVNNLQGTVDANGNPAFFSRELIAEINASDAPFVTPLLLWESFNDRSSKDSVKFIADTNYTAGQKIIMKSKNYDYPFEYFIQNNLNKNDTIMIQDIIQSKFFLGINGSVWMTKEALNFGKVPVWFKIANISGSAQSMAYSKDGNYLFVSSGTYAGSKVYRISNLLAAYDSLTLNTGTSNYLVKVDQIASFPGRTITSIAVDPNAPNRVVVTLGNFGSADYIYLSTNALDPTPLFESRQGNLPKMPVYSAIIEMSNPYTVIIGTEYGVYATARIYESNTRWDEENTGGEKVPVFMIRQQTMIHQDVYNSGMIYIGTHGRGFFETNRYYIPVGIDENPSVVDNTNLSIYPNPVRETANVSFNLNSSKNVIINVYDINGKLVNTENLNNLPAGSQKTEINCSRFDKGVYIIQLKAGKNTTSGKFIVM